MEHFAYCSFCFKSFKEDDVDKLEHIVTPKTNIRICHDCIDYRKSNEYYFMAKETHRAVNTASKASASPASPSGRTTAAQHSRTREQIKELNKKGLLEIMTRDQDFHSCNSCRYKQLLNKDLPRSPFSPPRRELQRREVAVAP